jgi:hypothetical protein
MAATITQIIDAATGPAWPIEYSNRPSINTPGDGDLHGVNLNDKGNGKGLDIAISSVAITLILIFVSLRCYVRVFMMRRFFLDDSEWFDIYGTLGTPLTLVQLLCASQPSLPLVSARVLLLVRDA